MTTLRNMRLHRWRLGFTLIEVMVASAIAVVVSAAMFSIFLISSKFVGEGFIEARITNNAAVAIERMSRDMTMAFTVATTTVANRPVVSDAFQTITYTVPLAGGGTSQRRFRFVAASNELEWEVNNAGTWTRMGQSVFLEDVDEFYVDGPPNNTEGLIPFMLTVRMDLGVQGGVKRYTMVGRALPRNIEAVSAA